MASGAPLTMFTFGILSTIIATVLQLSARAAGIALLPGILKMTASTGFLITALSAGALRSRVGIALLVGLVFSWFGDLFLIGSGASYFLAGLVSFFIGHVCYSVAFVLHKTRLPLAGAALAVLLIPGILLSRWILPHVTDPGMRAPVIAYTCVITIMLALAVGCYPRPGGRWIVAGAFLFYLSDICVARGAFVAPGFINSLIGLPLYFGGQLLLAVSIAHLQGPSRRAE
ncbi:MAG: lysoplasmalogenase [Candidatus Hydrogenedentes bacterium]|nr:lysoplasmalogenase [Candidatus Hydrogenedentota bacterium]